ncbi:hypothetical protein AB674_11600 [Flavobacterium sp. ABG]|nr:hypothetical protein AB674_11600 [Flavobacterium sp. ABG]
MKKHLKYFIYLFLALAVIATDCTLDSQSKSADYYQSSYVILRKELAVRNLRLYKFSQLKSIGKTSFPILLNFVPIKEASGFQTRVLLRLCTHLHQNINSFIKQSVFVNEINTSRHFDTSLYSA